ncbi:hypothetical protein K525DRAFT_204038 [Schizophyllum commune Loenen D]|nr:hypothetical protein K525DRAFT_204038 [Schizophyllum commune Loenen D]
MGDEQPAYKIALDSLPSSILGAIADLDLREVRDLDQKTRRIVAAVKSAYNAHASIDRFPNDILERIFLLVQPQYDDFLPRWPGLNALEWMVITRVCRRWRLIAISFSALWTTLDLCRDRPADVGLAFLERSGDAPLTVFFSTEDLEQSYDDRYVLRHIFSQHRMRLEVLHLSVRDEEDLYDLAREHITSGAPNVYSLSLFVDSDDGVWTHQEPAKASCDLFGRMFPRVRKFAVSKCQAWKCIDCTHFSYLAMSGVYEDALLEILWRSPPLEELVFADSLGWARRYVSANPDEVWGLYSLPRLRKVQLSIHGSNFALLSHLDIPEACDTRLTDIRNRTRSALTTLLPPLSRFRPLMRPVHTVQLLSSSIAMQHDWVAFYPGHIFAGAIYDLQHLTGIANTNTRLVLQLESYMDETKLDGWWCLLYSMPKLHTLEVYGNAAQAFSVLFEAIMSKPESAGSLPCPALEALHLHVELTDITLTFSVWQLAGVRARASMPLRELLLHFDGCNKLQSFYALQHYETIRHTLELDSSGIPQGFRSEISQVSSKQLVEKIVQIAKPFWPTKGSRWAFVEMRPDPQTETETETEEDE